MKAREPDRDGEVSSSPMTLELTFNDSNFTESQSGQDIRPNEIEDAQCHHGQDHSGPNRMLILKPICKVFDFSASFRDFC